MNNLLKKTTIQNSSSETVSDNKAIKNGKSYFKITKRKVEFKLKIELQKGTSQEQEMETLLEVDKSSLQYLASLHPIAVYNVGFSSEIADAKNHHFAVLGVKSTLGYASTQGVPNPPVGGPHKEIFNGIPSSFQKNIRSLTSIK
jgi:hypothetical protein